MTDSMRQRKERYVRFAMEHLECDYFCIDSRRSPDSIADICSELGISVPESVEFRYCMYGGGSTEENRMMMRINYKDTFYPVADAMLDEVFFHYAQLIPREMIQSAMEREATSRVRSLMAEVERDKKAYHINEF